MNGRGSRGASSLVVMTMREPSFRSGRNILFTRFNHTLLLEAFYNFLGKEFEPLAIQIIREETYTDVGKNGKRELVPLDAVGEDF